MSYGVFFGVFRAPLTWRLPEKSPTTSEPGIMSSISLYRYESAVIYLFFLHSIGSQFVNMGKRGWYIPEFVFLVLVLNQKFGVAGGFRCSSGGHLSCWDLRCDHHPSEHTDVPHDQEDKGSRCEDGPLRRGIGWDLRRLPVLPQGSQQGGVAPWDCAKGIYLHNTHPLKMLCYVWL